jgi:hypothetical protein
MSRRAQRLVDMGLATAKDGNIHIPSRIVATLEQREIERVGQQMARERGLTYTPSQALAFQLVPWHPVLEKRIGQHISGLQRDDGGIEWTLGRNRGLSL